MRSVSTVAWVAWFLVALMIANQVPVFTNQYEQRIAAALDQSIEDNFYFHEIVDQQFGGDVEGFIQHHLDSEDPTFHTEGEVFRRNFDREAELWKEHKIRSDGSLLDNVRYIALHGDRNVIRGAWEIYRPALAPDIVFSLLGGVLIWFTTFALIAIAKIPFRLIAGRTTKSEP